MPELRALALAGKTPARLDAIHLIGQLGSCEDYGLLMDLVTDRDRRVREPASKAVDDIFARTMRHLFDRNAQTVTRDLVDKILGRDKGPEFETFIDLGEFRAEELNYLRERDPNEGEELFARLFVEVSPDGPIDPTEAPNSTRRWGSDMRNARTTAIDTIWSRTPSFFLDRIADRTRTDRAELILSGTHYKSDDFRTLLLQLVADPIDSVRDAAASKLEDYSDQTVVSVLAGLTRDKVALVRWDALLSLGAASPLTAIDEAVRFSEDPLLRATALDLIGRMKLPECLAKLEPLLTSKDRELAVAACTGISIMVDSSALDELLEIVRHGSKDLRAVAVSGLGNFDARLVSSTLMEQLEDHDRQVVINACASLGSVGDTRALPRLRKLCLSKDADVAEAASGAIGELMMKDNQLPPLRA